MPQTGRPETWHMTREIGFLVYPGFQLLDLSGPLTAFQVATKVATKQPYRLHVLSRNGGLIASSSGLQIKTKRVRRDALDTLVVAGGGAPGRPRDPALDVSETVNKLAGQSRRISSVCTGAFILARTGLLDGRQATTHWQFVALLQRLFPKVKVKGDAIFTKDDNIWTSAGISAGIDLALAMIEEDLGPAVARAVAQMLVVYHRRPGGQSQFSALLDMQPESDRIRKVLSYAREHLEQKLSTEKLAEVACLSSRQFRRAFVLETGGTPAKAVERLRAEAARDRIENTSEPIEVVARHTGFVDPERMRRAFLRLFGHPPQSIRRMARP
jgi:transcriptional regulator GlxA family with amidase domain